jgi:glycine C-acetyltransferase
MYRFPSRCLSTWSRKTPLVSSLNKSLDVLRAEGTYKTERVITSQMAPTVRMASGEKVLNFCANNYLGLANHERPANAARRVLDSHGLGDASVRFIIGTTDVHKALEAKIAEFHQKDDAILFAAAFDANGGLFEAILGPEDGVFSDELNHASIIDGIRLCKAKKHRFKHMDLADLRTQLASFRESAGPDVTALIMTDGVFSMDGDIAPLSEICDLADEFNAIVAIDDCHASGFMGANGVGASEETNSLDRIDIIVSTLGKALGGASGGFITGPQEVIDVLRQRARPYLFSNTLPPPIAGAALEVFHMLEESSDLRDQLRANTDRFRTKMTEAGFTLGGEVHPIAPVMLGDARLAADFAERMLAEGIYVIAFSFPVVPKGKARIRVQLSAAHTEADVDRAVAAFIKVGRDLKVIE